jgi:alkylhydroperoxidase/carboxymuconolactone decarboxylase family protein YurZ
MSDDIEDTDELPPTASTFADAQPDVWASYNALGKACTEAGPLDEETRRLVKLALAIGAESEGAVHSHVRRGLDEGLTADQLQHVASLSIPTLGFPQAMAARSWISDLTE